MIQEENSRCKQDIFVTLAIAALIHETDEAVRACAKKLIERAPRSICKNTLYPLSESREALSIIVDEVIYPSQEKLIGDIWVNGYEYEIYVIYREALFYDVKEMVDMIVHKFIQRGVVKGWLRMSFHYFIRRGYFSRWVDMGSSSVRKLALAESDDYFDDSIDT